MTVKVKTDFRDRENNFKLRKTGEQFEVSRERSDKLAGLDLVEIVTEKPENYGETHRYQLFCETHVKLSVQTAQGKTVKENREYEKRINPNEFTDIC